MLADKGKPHTLPFITTLVELIACDLEVDTQTFFWVFPPPLTDMVGGLAASSAMLSPVVQTVLQMGFEASLVESLVQTKYLLTGQHYTSVSDLVTDVLQAEQEDRQRGSQSRGEKGWCLKDEFTQKMWM